jgi:hypothetical protein
VLPLDGGWCWSLPLLLVLLLLLLLLLLLQMLQLYLLFSATAAAAVAVWLLLLLVGCAGRGRGGVGTCGGRMSRLSKQPCAVLRATSAWTGGPIPEQCTHDRAGRRIVHHACVTATTG